jgi:hypothetical protein
MEPVGYAERSDVEPDQDEVGRPAVTGVVEMFGKRIPAFLADPHSVGPGKGQTGNGYIWERFQNC